jgi:hypothetical protein
MYEPITILSAELSSLDYHTNTDRTNELRSVLLDKGLSFVGIKLEKGNTKQNAFMVVTPSYSDLLKLAKEFGQGSIFISDAERSTCEIKTEAGQIIPLGKLCSASVNSTITPQLKVSFTEDGKEHIFITMGEI